MTVMNPFCSLFTKYNYIGLKVKGLDIYIAPLTGKPEQQRFTMQSGVMTSISSRQCSAISDHPLPEQTDFRPTVCSLCVCVCVWYTKLATISL